MHKWALRCHLQLDNQHQQANEAAVASQNVFALLKQQHWQTLSVKPRENPQCADAEGLQAGAASLKSGSLEKSHVFSAASSAISADTARLMTVAS